jgi:integrase
MAVTRNPRAGLDDRWHKRVRGPDGTIRKERSAVYGKVARWRVRWVDDTGHEHTKVFRLNEAAQSHLDKMTAEVVKGEYVSPRSAVTFGVVAGEWLESKAAKKPNTTAGYRSLLDTLILPRWGETKLKEITHGDLQRWISGLSVNGSARFEGKGLSASRVIQSHQCMNAVLKYAIRTDRLARNVATGVEFPRKASAERRFLTHQQLLNLSKAVDRLSVDTFAPLGLMTLIMGYCGLRIGEVTALREKDVGDRTIAVRASVTKVDGRYVESDTKTHRTRRVPVPQFIWEELEKFRDPDPATRLFPGKRGHMTEWEYKRAFNPAAREIGMPGLTPHELRHTCASLAIAAGANVKALQTLLGHASAVMTLDRYGHLFSDDLTKVAEALNNAALAASDSPLG